MAGGNQRHLREFVYVLYILSGRGRSVICSRVSYRVSSDFVIARLIFWWQLEVVTRPLQVDRSVTEATAPNRNDALGALAGRTVV